MVAVVADSLTLRDLSVQHNSIFFAEDARETQRKGDKSERGIDATRI